MKIKRLVAGLLLGTLTLLTATGCGSSTASSSGNASSKTIKIAASATPHAEILEKAKDLMAQKGWTLDVSVFNDYVQPNLVVESGEFDANYTQHVPYLDSF